MVRNVRACTLCPVRQNRKGHSEAKCNPIRRQSSRLHTTLCSTIIQEVTEMRVTISTALVAAMFTVPVCLAQVRVVFDPRSPDAGPIPADFLTVPDSQQKTGLRINLPMLPDCKVDPATCSELTLLNQSDGFSLFPRLAVRSNSAIDRHAARRRVCRLARWSCRGRFRIVPARLCDLGQPGPLVPTNKYGVHDSGHDPGTHAPLRPIHRR